MYEHRHAEVRMHTRRLVPLSLTLMLFACDEPAQQPTKTTNTANTTNTTNTGSDTTASTALAVETTKPAEPQAETAAPVKEQPEDDVARLEKLDAEHVAFRTANTFHADPSQKRFGDPELIKIHQAKLRESKKLMAAYADLLNAKDEEIVSIAKFRRLQLTLAYACDATLTPDSAEAPAEKVKGNRRALEFSYHFMIKSAYVNLAKLIAPDAQGVHPEVVKLAKTTHDTLAPLQKDGEPWEKQLAARSKACETLKPIWTGPLETFQLSSPAKQQD